MEDTGRFKEFTDKNTELIERVKKVLANTPAPDGDSLSERLNELSSWNAYVGELAAEIEAIRDLYLGEAIQHTATEFPRLNATQIGNVAKAKISPITEKFLDIANLKSAINSTIKITISQLSYQKELYHDSKIGGGH